MWWKSPLVGPIVVRSHIPSYRGYNPEILLTSRDLILYDYSVNDALCFTSSKQLLRLNGVWKTLSRNSFIILQMVLLPLCYFITPFKSLNFGTEKPDPESISKSYWEVAKQFQLPIIFYRDLFWHPLFREDLKRIPIFWSINGRILRKWTFIRLGYFMMSMRMSFPGRWNSLISCVRRRITW
jgi:hypothetical protein